MKKTIYTVAFFAFIAFTGNAQTSNNAVSPDDSKKEFKKQVVNPDGTLANDVKEAEVKTEKASKEVPVTKDGTRMAITEKGVPAAKKKAKTEGTK
jgi:hypothetical protein